MNEGHWEYGSDFPLIAPAGRGRSAPDPWHGERRFYASGRAALVALLSGGAAGGWKRLLVPSYFCVDVVEAVKAHPFPVAYYPCSPESETPPAAANLRPGDVVLRVHYFGLAGDRPESWELPSGVEIIEDHTHDPWSAWAYASDADWCIASLRKTLPLPDGGVVWSPRGHSLPPDPALSVQHRSAAALKLAGMALKATYLAGAPVAKDAFRELLIAGEHALASPEVSAISPAAATLLEGFDVGAWREGRRRNHRVLAGLLDGIPGVSIHLGAARATPLALILSFPDGDRRDAVRARLIDNAIYPAVLWPAMADAPAEPFVRRMLAFHCDARYDVRDVVRAGTVLRDIVTAFR